MADNPGKHRPTGKRQLSGAAETSTDTFENRRASRAASNDADSTPGNGIKGFFPEVVSEVKKVVWPTAKEMTQYTIVVFGFLIVLTALVWGVDALAGMGVEAVLVR